MQSRGKDRNRKSPKKIVTVVFVAVNGDRRLDQKGENDNNGERGPADRRRRCPGRSRHRRLSFVASRWM